MIPQTGKELPPAAVAALAQGRTIDAIKAVRAANGISLREAKEAVDAYVRLRPDLAAKLAAANAAALKVLFAIVGMMAAVSFLAYWLLVRK